MRNLQSRLLESASLIGICLATTWHILVTEDLTLHDEASYLSLGASTFEGHRAAFVDGASYIDLYALLFQFSSNPVGIYFVMRVLVAVLVVLTTWFAARLLAKPGFALLAALMMSMSAIPYTWPGVAGPATAAIVLACAITWRSPSIITASIASSLVWLAAASRPEYSIAAVGVTALTVTLAIPKFRVAFRARFVGLGLSVLSVALAIFTPLILFALHGFPLDTRNRQWDAFRQHFALHVAGPNENPWYQFVSISRRFFGDAGGIVDAAGSNPEAFARHIALNMLELPRALLAILSPSVANLGLPLRLGGYALAIVLISLVAFIASTGGRKSLNSFRFTTSIRDHVLTVAIAGVLFASSAIAAIVIFPRNHYLLSWGVLAVVVSVASLSKIRLVWKPVAWVAWCVILLFGLFSLSLVRGGIARVSEPAPIAATIANMDRDGREWRLLGVQWGLEAYSSRITQISTTQPRVGETFNEFLARLDVNAVAIDELFLTSDWGQLPGAKEFYANPAEFGVHPAANGSPIWLVR